MAVTLLTGGSGRLGRELQKLGYFCAPPRDTLDITKPITPKPNVDLIIHAAAFTNVDAAELYPNPCIEVNVGGTVRLLDAYRDVPFVYISSEHAPKAVNIYSASKYAAEEAVRALSPHYLIIRTLFKPNPYPFDNAWADQITQGDYVDVIAPLILAAIEKWDKKTCGTILVGTGRKTILELARRTKPSVRPSSYKDWPGAKRAGDYV